MKRTLFGKEEYDNKPVFILEYAIPRLANEKEVLASEEEYNKILSDPLINDEKLASLAEILTPPIYSFEPWTLVPEIITRRCLSFEYVDDETMDSLQLKFSNHDLFLFYGDPNDKENDYLIFRDLMNPGTLIRCKFGYDNFLTPWRYTKVLTFSGLKEITIMGYELMLVRFVKQGIPSSINLENKTLKEIVITLGKKLFDLAEEKYDNSSFVVEELLDPSSNEEEQKPLMPIEINIPENISILGFLQDLAEKYGYQCWLEDEGDNYSNTSKYVLYFKPRDFLQSATWKFSYVVDLSDEQKIKSSFINIDGKQENLVFGGPILQIDDPTCDTRDKSIYTQLQEIDPISGEIVRAKFRYSDPVYNESGERTFITRHYQDIHGIGGENSLGSQFYDLHFIYSKSGKDESNAIQVGNVSQDPEIIKLTGYVSCLSQILHLDGFPTAEQFESILNIYFAGDKKQNAIKDMFGELAVFGYYGTAWNFIGGLKLQIFESWAKFKSDLRDLKNNLRITKETKSLDRSEAIATNTAKELWEILFGKNFREMTATMNMGFKIIGNPDVKARQTSEIQGTIAYDTKWYHKKVIHTIDSNGFISKIESISNSTIFEKGENGKRIRPENHPVMVRNRLFNIEQKQSEIGTERETLSIVQENLENHKKEQEELTKEVTSLLDIVRQMSELNKQTESLDNSIKYDELMESLEYGVSSFQDQLASFNIKWGEVSEELTLTVANFTQKEAFYAFLRFNFTSNQPEFQYIKFNDSVDDKNIGIAYLINQAKQNSIRFTFHYDPVPDRTKQNSSRVANRATRPKPIAPPNYNQNSYQTVLGFAIGACKEQGFISPNNSIVWPADALRTIIAHFNLMRSSPDRFGLPNNPWNETDNYELLMQIGRAYIFCHGKDSLKNNNIKTLPSSLGMSKTDVAFMCATQGTGADYISSTLGLTIEEKRKVGVTLNRYRSSKNRDSANQGTPSRSNRG